MDRLHKMKDCLIDVAMEQIYNNLECVDTKELGEVIDMIKDIEEAIYYGTITKAMHESDKKEKEHHMTEMMPHEMMKK